MFNGCGWVTISPTPCITAELLVVIKETENDDLTGVLEELIDTYPHQIGDVAVGLCQHLVIHSLCQYSILHSVCYCTPYPVVICNLCYLMYL